MTFFLAMSKFTFLKAYSDEEGSDTFRPSRRMFAQGFCVLRTNLSFSSQRNCKRDRGN